MREKPPRSVPRERRLLSSVAWLLVLSIVVLAARAPHASGQLPGDAHPGVPVSQETFGTHGDVEATGAMEPDCADTACSTCLGVVADASGAVPLAGMVPSSPRPGDLLSITADRLYRPPIRSS